MIVFKIILLCLFISMCQCRLPDKVYCVNQECSGPISKAKTLLSYNSGDEDLMSFRGNAEATIYMKSAGTNPDLWYADINGQTGFVNSKFLREYKIIEKHPQFVVSVDPKSTQKVKPDKVQQAHEVFEGTTIFTPEASTTHTPATEAVESLTSITESQESSSQNTNDNNFHNVPSDTSNFEIIMNQNIDDNPTIPSSEEILKTNENVVDPNSQTEIPTLASTTENPAENIDISVSNEQTYSLPDNNQFLPDSSEHVPAPQPDISSSEHVVAAETTPDTNQVDFAPTSTENPEIANEINTSLPSNLINNVEGIVQPLPNLPKVPNPELYVTVPPSYENLYVTISPDNQNLYVTSPPNNENFHAMTTPNTENLHVTSSPNNENAQITITPYDDVQVTTPPNNENVYVNTAPNNENVYVTNAPNNENVYVNTAPDNENVYVNTAPNNENVYINTAPNENIFIPQVPEMAIPNQHENYLLNNMNLGDMNLNGMQIPDVPVAAPQVFDTIPPAFADTIKVSTTPDSVPVNNVQTIPASTEVNYSPNTEATPVEDIASTESTESMVSQEEIISTTQSVPTQSSEDLTIAEDITLPTTLVTSQENTILGHEEVTQSTNYENIESESTTEFVPPSTTESPNEDVYSTSEDPTSEDNSESILSNLYSTIADIWPSSTEAPPPEKIFNPDFIHTDVPEAAETNENFSFMAYVISTYKLVMGSREESRALFATPGETCYKDEYCDGESTGNKNRLLTFLVTTAVSVLLFTLGYYYIDNRRQDSRLIGTINGLQRDLLFSTKECEILKEELTSTKSKLAGIEDNSFGMDDMVLSLKEEINELKAQNERLRKSLDDNEKLLRVSENTASELQNTLSDVENTLSELLVERAATEDHIAELNGKVQAFEEELISVSRDRDNYQLKYVSAESAVEESKKLKRQLEELNKKLSEAQNTIELQKHEITALKDVVKELKSGAPSDVDVNSLLDHTEIKAKLSKVSEEKDTYMTKYELEHNERVRLTQELAVTQESLQSTTTQATEALTRLEVLGKYFQQRESELVKELATKESLWLSKQGESTSTIEKMEILQQEAQRYKEKCDALTLELAEQESMRRTAISEIEARAHTAWLEARQAKRDADAAKDEAAALRRKLASLHQADGAASPHRPVASPLEMVDSTMLPPPMLPLSFMPPPILPPLPRPPPLGRLPSPRPSRYDRDYGPGKRYTPGPHPGDPPHYPPDYSPTRDAHSPVDFRYPPPSDYIRSMESEREYSRRDRGSTECSPHERGSSWEREGRYTETEYHSDSPSRRRRRRRRYARLHSGPSSASSHTESDDSGK